MTTICWITIHRKISVIEHSHLVSIGHMNNTLKPLVCKYKIYIELELYWFSRPSRPVDECGNPHPACIGLINSRGCGLIVPNYAALHMRTHQWISHVATFSAAICHCEKWIRVVLTQFGYLSFLPLLHHEIQWRPTACFTFQTVMRFSRELVNVMGECIASEIVHKLHTFRTVTMAMASITKLPATSTHLPL